MRIVTSSPYFLHIFYGEETVDKSCSNSYDGAALFMMAMLFLMASGSASTPVTLFREQRSMGDFSSIATTANLLKDSSMILKGRWCRVWLISNSSFSEGNRRAAQT